MDWYERVRVIIAAYYMAAKYLICELLGRKIGIYQGLENKKFPRQNGRYAIVTGGSRGIGFEIVNNLLESGYNVVIGSSSSEVNRKVLEQTFKRKYENSSVEVWHLDLVSLKSVKAFVEKYLSTGRPLHLLINNAGIMFVKEEYTEDGFEKHFAVNYVSHCLLTLLLLPLLAKSGTSNRYSRIINSTSCIHYVGFKDSKYLQKKAYYSKYGAYIQSKLAQVMFTYSLQAHLSAENIYVTVNCVHPGVVNTELMSSVLWISLVGSIGSFLLRIFLKSAKQGAETATFAALSPEMEGIGGKYLEECRPVPSSKISQDRVLQNDLWIETWDSLKDWIPKGNAFSHWFFPISK